MPDNSGAVDLGAQQAEPQTEEIQEEQGPRQVLTAFIVIVNTDGNPEVATFADPSLDVTFPPTPDLIYGAVSTLKKDISSQELVQVIVPATAQTVVTHLQRQAQQAFEQQAAQESLQRLGDLKGGRRG